MDQHILYSLVKINGPILFPLWSRRHHRQVWPHPVCLQVSLIILHRDFYLLHLLLSSALTFFFISSFSTSSFASSSYSSSTVFPPPAGPTLELGLAELLAPRGRFVIITFQGTFWGRKQESRGRKEREDRAVKST